MYEICYNSKNEALVDIFDIEDIQTKWSSRKVSIDLLLATLSKSDYNLKEDLNLSSSGVSKLLTHLWPDRPKNNAKVCTWLLSKYWLKHCIKCGAILTLDSFHNSKASYTGKNSYCIRCFNVSVKDMRKEYEAFRRAEKLKRTPSWADTFKIKEFYGNCPAGMHVDHILPLQGLLVSGLHVHNNLQYLSAQDNIKKSNNFTPV